MTEEKEIKTTEAAVADALNPADVQKQLGNDAFAAKKFDDAIGFYSEAIKLDHENAIYYSNRRCNLFTYVALFCYSKSI